MRSAALIIGLAVSFGAVLIGCQPMSDNSLLTDQKKSYSDRLLNKEPRQEELYLKADVTNVSTNSASSKVDISGECFTSTYPTHKIFVRLGATQGQLEVVDYNVNTDVNYPWSTCKNGRFNFALNTSAFSVGTHKIQLSLEGTDSRGGVVTNEVQGSASFTLVKSSLPGF